MSHDALHLFVAGGRVSGGGRCTIPVTNPATGEELGRLPAATTADLDEAVDAADRAFRPWRRVTPFERGRILRDPVFRTERCAACNRGASGTISLEEDPCRISRVVSPS